jgi:hypothetical protein
MIKHHLVYDEFTMGLYGFIWFYDGIILPEIFHPEDFTPFNIPGRIS